MTQTTLFLTYSLLTAALDNLGNGLQKGGASWLESGPKALLKGRGWRAFLTWAAGIAMCIAAPFVLGLALTKGPATLAAALGVFGLIPLYLYASLVLKEKITGYHAVALVLILLGTMFVAFKSLGLELPEAQFRSERLLSILLLSLGSTGAWSLWALGRKSAYVGFALGTLSGMIGGINLLNLKVGAVQNAWWAAGGLWVALSTANFFILQLAYLKSSALQVVPSNTTVAVLFPMVVAPIIFAEPIPAWLVLGTLPSIVAIALLAMGERVSDEPEGNV